MFTKEEFVRFERFRNFVRFSNNIFNRRRRGIVGNYEKEKEVILIKRRRYYFKVRRKSP